jgi:hypothetical protein
LAQQVNENETLTGYGIAAGVGVSSTVVRMAGTDQSVTVSASVNIAGGNGSDTGSETFTITGPFARSWTPDTTVQYSLDDDDFIVQESSVGTYLGVTPGSPALRLGAGPITGGFLDDPLQVTRSTPADAMNYVQLECLDRAYSYNTQIVEAFDQAMVDLYGVRKDTSLKARTIADPALCGQTVATLTLQRVTAYRNTYSFSLGWAYCLLEPMDLVAISDSYLGIANKVVRITSVAEDEEGTLAFTAEDFLGTIEGPNGPIVYGGSPGAAASRPTQGFAPTASVPNFSNNAQSVAAPFILEPTAQLLAAQGLAQPQIVSDCARRARSGEVPASMSRSTTKAMRSSAASSAARRWGSRPPISHRRRRASRSTSRNAPAPGRRGSRAAHWAASRRALRRVAVRDPRIERRP